MLETCRMVLGCYKLGVFLTCLVIWSFSARNVKIISEIQIKNHIIWFCVSSSGCHSSANVLKLELASYLAN